MSHVCYEQYGASWVFHNASGHIQVPYSFRSGCYRVTATASRAPASTAPMCADEAAVSWRPGGGSARPVAGRAITQRSAFLAGGTGLS